VSGHGKRAARLFRSRHLRLRTAQRRCLALKSQVERSGTCVFNGLTPDLASTPDRPSSTRGGLRAVQGRPSVSGHGKLAFAPFPVQTPSASDGPAPVSGLEKSSGAKRNLRFQWPDTRLGEHTRQAEQHPGGLRAIQGRPPVSGHGKRAVAPFPVQTPSASDGPAPVSGLEKSSGAKRNLRFQWPDTRLGEQRSGTCVFNGLTPDLASTPDRPSSTRGGLRAVQGRPSVSGHGKLAARLFRSRHLRLRPAQRRCLALKSQVERSGTCVFNGLTPDLASSEAELAFSMA
jgi:hypothetical protein